MTFDYDRDGDQDLFIVNNNAAPILYRNDSANSNAWLQIETVGTQSNRDGIGTLITLVADLANPDELQFREIDGGNNFLGQNEKTAHFGLGLLTKRIDQITIQWPSGRVLVLSNVAPNKRLIVTKLIPEPASLSMLLLATLLLKLSPRSLLTQPI